MHKNRCTKCRLLALSALRISLSGELDRASHWETQFREFSISRCRLLAPILRSLLMRVVAGRDWRENRNESHLASLNGPRQGALWYPQHAVVRTSTHRQTVCDRVPWKTTIKTLWICSTICRPQSGLTCSASRNFEFGEFGSLASDALGCISNFVVSVLT